MRSSRIAPLRNMRRPGCARLILCWSARWRQWFMRVWLHSVQMEMLWWQMQLFALLHFHPGIFYWLWVSFRRSLLSGIVLECGSSDLAWSHSLKNYFTNCFHFAVGLVLLFDGICNFCQFFAKLRWKDSTYGIDKSITQTLIMRVFEFDRLSMILQLL